MICVLLLLGLIVSQEVRVVYSHDATPRFLAFRGREPRLFTAEEIRELDLCTHFKIDGPRTPIVSNDVFLCRNLFRPEVYGCPLYTGLEMAKDWLIQKRGIYARIVMMSDGACLTNTGFSMRNEPGHILRADPCDDFNTSQLFEVVDFHGPKNHRDLLVF
jgi:hypothetical protein